MIWTSLIAQGKRRLWMSLFVAILVSLVYAHLARFYQGRVSPWILGALGAPILLNLLRAGLGLVYRLDRHPFRVLDLGLRSDQVAPGKSLDVEVVLEARRPGSLIRLEVELRSIRRKYGEGGGEGAALHRDRRTVESDAALEPGVRERYPISIALPRDAPYSYRSMEGKLAWLLAVEAEVAGWGAVRDEIEVTVAPD